MLLFYLSATYLELPFICFRCTFPRPLSTLVVLFIPLITSPQGCFSVYFVYFIPSTFSLRVMLMLISNAKVL